MRKNLIAIAAAVLASTLVIGCSQKGPAEIALKAAETSVSEVRDAGSKFAPDQFKGLSNAFNAAQDSFKKGDYKAALEGAQPIPAKAKEVAAAAAAKKEEMTKAWNDLSAGVAPLADSVKARFADLDKMKKLPAGLDAAKVTGAKEAFSAAQVQWQEASEAFKAGNISDALAKGKTAKEKANEILAAMTPPPPPPAPAKPAAKPAVKAKAKPKAK
jgi:hypothetical protein